MEPKLEALLTEHERLLDEIVSDQEYVTFFSHFLFFFLQIRQVPKSLNFQNKWFFKVNNFTTRKQLNEEALKILKKEKQTEHCEHWVCVGDFFIKLPHHTITHILEKGPFFFHRLFFFLVDWNKALSSLRTSEAWEWAKFSFKISTRQGTTTSISWKPTLSYFACLLSTKTIKIFFSRSTLFSHGNNKFYHRSDFCCWVSSRKRLKKMLLFFLWFSILTTLWFLKKFPTIF